MDHRTTHLVQRNDYEPLRPSPGRQWRPELSVSVVVPAHGNQDKLDLVCAALAAQTYPAHLMEVVVVDDGSDPPLRLPEIRPERCRLIPAGEGGWGSAHAVNTGVAACDGAVILRLDADMLVFHDHVEQQMHWHHQADYLVALGHKRFVDYRPGLLDPKEVNAAVQRGEADALFDAGDSEPHWVERVIDSTERLREADHMAYRVFVGATGSLHRALFDEAGRMDPALILGGDSEFAYRVGQCGAVFVPELESSSWHLGRSQMQTRKDAGRSYRFPYVANRVPPFERRRNTQGRLWEVPYIDVVVDAAEATTEEVAATVDPILAGPLHDVRVTLVGPWDRVVEGRHAVLDDPDVVARLVVETYRGDPRVRLRMRPPEPEPAVPFRLLLAAGPALTRHALRAATRLIDRDRAGLLRLALPGGGTARLERHSAFARARRAAPADASPEELDRLADQAHGVVDADAVTAEVVADPDAEPEPLTDWYSLLAKAHQEAARERDRADRLQRQLRATPSFRLRRIRKGVWRRMTGAFSRSAG